MGDWAGPVRVVLHVLLLVLWEMWSDHIYVISGIALCCNLFTWLESSAGFCFGCAVNNRYIVPHFGSSTYMYFYSK